MSKNINRRTFLKYLGGGVAATSAVLAACKGKQDDTAQLGEPPVGKMTYRTNPNSGDKVSLLGYGMMRLPTIDNLDKPEGQPDEIDQEMVNQQVDYAIEHGVNYFDTSPVYCQGMSETSTGIALHRHKRSEYFIATKLSNFGAQAWPLSESQKMFETSLKNLQVEYLDYLLLHGTGMGSTDIEGNNLDGMEAFEARFMDNGLLDWLVEQKQAGRIRNLGFSYHGDVDVFDLLLQWHDEGRYHWDFVQIELNYLDWEFADEINSRNTDAVYLYGELEKRGIPAVIMEPLLGGRLANLPDSIVSRLKQRDNNASVASWAFRFAGTPQGVMTVLSGMTYMDHLRENLWTYSPLRPISAEENDLLMQIAREIYNLKTIPCNECNYCMPCKFGINIPAIFSHYNKCIREGNIPSKAQRSEDYLHARRAFLIGYDRSVPRLRQASHCIGCGACVSHCPQRIDIPRELHLIDEFVERMKQGVTLEDFVNNA